MPDQPTLDPLLDAPETVENVMDHFLATLYEKDDTDLVTVLCSGIENALQNEQAANGDRIDGQTRTLLAVKAASGVLLSRYLPHEFGAWLEKFYGTDDDDDQEEVES